MLTVSTSVSMVIIEGKMAAGGSWGSIWELTIIPPTLPSSSNKDTPSKQFLQLGTKNLSIQAYDPVEAISIQTTTGLFSWSHDIWMKDGLKVIDSDSQIEVKLQVLLQALCFLL